MYEEVTLELSLKPFKKTDDAYIQSIAREIFTAWRPLVLGARTISVMLWVGDGSELLDYAGTLDDAFEWCRFLGTANLPTLSEHEPIETSLHSRRQHYMENAPTMTYRILKNIVRILKEEGKRQYPDSEIKIGETFDIGPEFAISDFKYKRHGEICCGTRLDNLGFVDATALLHADTRAYAAYPDGIPEGEPFGTFLGKQSAKFLPDMGFDYLWLSNGLGFSADPWKKTGKIFDGERYYPDRLVETRERVFLFWRLFREVCDIPLKTRGTNNSVGIDYASDGVPLYDIYRAELDITAPPNSPWAALNDNYGLEMMGHMTRVAELPSEVFPFRYYLHDPWWVNSPWYDRYNGTPCDIYLPMAISRIDKDGKTQAANTLNILSIDNSYGDMPCACVNEVTAHLLKAKKDAPDRPAPIVWVYPVREFTTATDAEMLAEMHLGDCYVQDAINDGFPLCCVVSADNFLSHGADVYRGALLLSPVPTSDALRAKLLRYAKEHGVLMYGTEQMLSTIPDGEGLVKLDVKKSASQLREALASFGYVVRFEKRAEGTKPPTLAISRSDNAFHFSVYNANTTTDTYLRLPQGAPILDCSETVLGGGEALYRFGRAEHKECRILVDQTAESVISCREQAPVNRRFRRRIALCGLVDASVYFFPECGCECAVTRNKKGDPTPIFMEGFTLVHDKEVGTYLYGEHIDGDIFFLMGYRGTQAKDSF